jgi:hypothetical protein
MRYYSSFFCWCAPCISLLLTTFTDRLLHKDVHVFLRICIRQKDWLTEFFGTRNIGYKMLCAPSNHSSKNAVKYWWSRKRVPFLSRMYACQNRAVTQVRSISALNMSWLFLENLLKLIELIYWKCVLIYNIRVWEQRAEDNIWTHEREIKTTILIIT